MKMLLPLLLKELSFWFRRPGVHAFWVLFFLLGLLTMGSMAGDFEFIQVGGAGGLAKSDAPRLLLQLSLVFGLFITMNIAAAAGGAATRDVTEGMHALVYATPMPKWVWATHRVLGALAVSTWLYLAPLLGMMAGRVLLPGLEPERLGAFDPLSTLAATLVWGLPNVVLTVGVFFALGAVTRRMFPVYIGGVFLFVGYLGSAAFLRDLDNRTLGILIDPFGTAALGQITRYWTPAEQNTLVPWPTGASLVNRVLWLGVGLSTLLGGVALARLDQYGWQPLGRFRRPETDGELPDAPAASVALPTLTRSFDTGVRVRQLVALGRRALGDVVGHRYFWAFVGAAVLFELLNSQAIGTSYGTDTFPVTYQVLQIFEGTLGIFMLVILTFYAGDLVWAERDLGQAQLLDSSPVPDALPLLAKALALSAVLVGLHTTILVLGPLVQLVNGYTHFEIGLYLQSLYGLSLVDWLPYVALALVVHAVVNHKVAGHAVMIGLYIAMMFRGSWGFEYNLPWFGADPGRQYSDMNGWGFALGPFLAFKAYWLAVGAWLLVVARLAWVRGTDAGWRPRLAEARRRLDGPTRVALGATSVVVLALGGFLGWQTAFVSPYEHSVDGKRQQVTYETRYRARWLDAPHPLVESVTARVDLYPAEGKARVEGTLAVVNPHDVALTELLIQVPDRDLVDDLSFGIPYTETVDDLDVLHWTLERPMAPGERTELSFRTRHGYDGIPNSGFETSVVENGTFLHHYEVFPSFGYDPSWELSDPADRRTYDLPERDRMRDLDDPLVRHHHYLTDDAHRVDSDITVSTVAGQIPLAPGEQVASSEADGRVEARFVAESIHYFLAFLSADWTVTRRDDGVVPVAVYSHPGHPYNVERMLDSMQAAFATFERDFGPYQHDHLNIVEFPRYATYAQAFPTLVPFSEGIGFIAHVYDPEEDLDYPVYVTAHEVAHQWWAHQIIAGNGQGATVLSESLAQYSALRVMEDFYGKDHIGRFLEYEQDRYFRGRGQERDRELPLMRVENQPYIHYQKGGNVLYSLSERVGRTEFDAAVRSFLERWRFRGPPYPTARDFVEHLHDRFPEERAAIVDGFERIVTHDLRLEEAVATRAGEGWTVALTVKARRQIADEEGAQEEAPFADTVQVRVDHPDGEPSLHVVEVDGDGVVEVTVDREPERAELDPRFLFLDRDRDDNEATVAR